MLWSDQELTLANKISYSLHECKWLHILRLKDIVGKLEKQKQKTHSYLQITDRDYMNIWRGMGRFFLTLMLYNSI